MKFRNSGRFSPNTRYQPCPRCRERGNDNAGDNLVMWPDGSGHCFSCGYHLPAKHYVKKEVIPDAPKSLRPTDFTREVPAKCLQWLLQFGLPWSHWKDSIGYSEAEQRLVFEVRDDHQLRFSIGRYFGNRSDPAPRKWYVWGEPHRHCQILNPGHKQIILVEDLISANKVAAAGHTCIPLFGVNVQKPHLYYLINESKPVVLWLDKDQEMQSKHKAVHLQSIIGQQVVVQCTDKDPKYLTFNQINEVLNA